MKKVFLVNFQDGMTAIHEAETSQEIFNRFEGKVSSCIDLELVKELIAEYEDYVEKGIDCDCGHSEAAHGQYEGFTQACKYCDCNQYIAPIESTAREIISFEQYEENWKLGYVNLTKQIKE